MPAKQVDALACISAGHLHGHLSSVRAGLPRALMTWGCMMGANTYNNFSRSEASLGLQGIVLAAVLWLAVVPTWCRASFPICTSTKFECSAFCRLPGLHSYRWDSGFMQLTRNVSSLHATPWCSCPDVLLSGCILSARVQYFAMLCLFGHSLTARTPVDSPCLCCVS